VYSAKSLGATFIKAFPGNLLGPAFIRAVLSVLPDLKMMPTGGVEPNKINLKSWFDSGVVCVGMGSQLFDKNALLKGDYDSLEIRVKDSLKIVQSLKG
jgi:2-dehydro-3-deoxyphosphogluconate aldolase/(4S)-4-hydroxy-2-oxoglutarate aldolase